VPFYVKKGLMKGSYSSLLSNMGYKSTSDNYSERLSGHVGRLKDIIRKHINQIESLPLETDLVHYNYLPLPEFKIRWGQVKFLVERKDEYSIYKFFESFLSGKNKESVLLAFRWLLSTKKKKKRELDFQIKRLDEILDIQYNILVPELENLLFEYHFD
jgi:hypothetical protein